MRVVDLIDTVIGIMREKGQEDVLYAE